MEDTDRNEVSKTHPVNRRRIWSSAFACLFFAAAFFWLGSLLDGYFQSLWNGVQVDMSPAEVRELIGEPDFEQEIPKHLRMFPGVKLLWIYERAGKNGSDTEYRVYFLDGQVFVTEQWNEKD